MLVAVCLSALLLGGITPETKTVQIGSHSIKVTVIRAKLSDVKMRVGLAKGRVGATEDLAGIAKRYGAIAAINGCHFDAYSTKAVRNPYHNIITDGVLSHIGNTGPTIGFDAKGNAKIEPVQIGIEGAVWGRNGKSRNFYAYRVNHLPEGPNTATVFNRNYGEKTGLDGAQVTVLNGKVTWTGNSSCTIPDGGFAFLFTGGDAAESRYFNVGDEVGFRMVIKSGGDAAFWKSVEEGLGCGPTLVRSGEVWCHPAEEGFRDPKVLSGSSTRSAVGLTAKGEILLVAGSGTVYQMAEVMKNLGCTDALGMDSGASSGLYANGKYVRKPGRNLPNALLICAK